MVQKSALPFNQLNLADYTYHLPTEKIAEYPLPERDASKLLIYRKGNISHKRFSHVPEALPAESLLVLNNTRVLPARLFFKKDSGAIIEIFLMEPVAPSRDMATAMLATKNCTWKCIIGNKKRWKDNSQLSLQNSGEVDIKAVLVDRDANLVEFTFGDIAFSEVIEHIGSMPLPPYMNRKANEADSERYQTVFSKVKGAVAAPTASLHFTEKVLNSIQQIGHKTTEVTLHVGAGTFQPIKDNDIANHPMHHEWFQINIATLQQLYDHSGPIIPVGTTTCRTLESVYWLGITLLLEGKLPDELPKDIGFRYSEDELPDRRECLLALIEYVTEKQMESLQCSTGIFIVPGYSFRMCDGLITNFHQPGSTLILLVAALVGSDWQRIYQQALENDYRFLSYGDSSILLP
jgi:S-adenosylmethionine:tRNA ribosyltransferase-isomerase